MGLMLMNTRIWLFHFHCILYMVFFHQKTWNVVVVSYMVRGEVTGLRHHTSSYVIALVLIS